MVDKKKIREFAPAKINLYLHVTGKREDGYHLLDSLIAFADIGDWIEVEESEELSLSIKGRFGNHLGGGEDNLVLRATRMLQDKASIKKGAKITLEKNLPIASGIGGGSADAAATLRALQKLWSSESLIPHHQLITLATSLGADIPVCLTNRTSYFGGIGEIIDKIPEELPETYILLMNPLIATPTPEIFRRRQGHFSPPARLLGWPKDVQDLARELEARHNDLEKPAQEMVPIIGEMIGAIGGTPDCLLARMSGSGATCFGLYASAPAAMSAKKILEERYPNWWLAAGRLKG